MDDSKIPPRPRRNRRGRFVKGVSGNPAGKPVGCLNRATRIAAGMLGGQAEALLRTEIDLALAGDRMLLRHCVDRIIAPPAGRVRHAGGRRHCRAGRRADGG